MAATAPALVAPASSPGRAGTVGEEDGAPCPDGDMQPMQGVSSTDGVDAANVACIFLPQAHDGPGAPALGATADGADAVSCAAQLDDDGLAAFLDAVKEGMRIDESRMLVFNGPDWLVNGVGLQMDEERQHFVHAMLDGLQVPDDAIAAVFVRSRLARRVAVARVNDWAVPDEEMVLPFLCVSFNLEAQALQVYSQLRAKLPKVGGTVFSWVPMQRQFGGPPGPSNGMCMHKVRVARAGSE